jgi:type II secretory pathway component GspD/PulD (secretin)
METRVPLLNHRIIRALFVAWWFVVAASAHAQSVEVIPLKYRTAEQVIPVLQPLLDKSGSISGLQNQLIIRTTPSNLADLRKVLASIDTMPRRLLISVRQDADIDRERSAGQLSGSMSTGNATISVPGGRGGSNVEIRSGDDVARGRVESTRSLDSDRNTQTIQVLDGSSAYIRVGQSVPVPQRSLGRPLINGRYLDQVNNGVEYRDVTSGFYALPRIAGDRVIIEISQQNDTLRRPEQNLPRGSVNVQGAVTTVSGRLGEWIEVGGIGQTSSSEQSVLLGSTRSNSTDSRRILLKVDELH